MKRRVIAGTIAIGLIVALAGATLATTASSDVASSGKKAKKFKPKKFTGDWKGQWRNLTFRTKGTATMTLSTKGKKKFIGVFDLGGNAFGCDDPDPRERVMKKGKGPNTWNKKGFNVKYNNGQGIVKLKYKAKKKKISGKGVSPCPDVDLSYKYKGKMTKKSVSADVDIFDPAGNKFAESTFSLKKG
ncbi:MAG TPA: hypothetical protein VKA36_07070 [Solirubrobacterales bacterium]|nr:hypothetical protein [Solirubrobacterales bacterium]